MNEFQADIAKIVGADKAKEIVKFFDAKKQQKPPLTDRQQAVLDYLCSGQPISSQRQLAEASGLDNSQQLVAVLSALVVKGYLIPKKEINHE